MKIVIKLGGFAFPTQLSPDFIQRYAELIRRLHREHGLVIVTGGGDDARRYIYAARKLGASEVICDQLGIYVTRVNAHLMISSLPGDAYPEVPESVEELRRFFATGKIVVMGGLQPGQSTNAVAAIAAETIGADVLINATDVEGVYTSDPSIDPKAKRLPEISTQQLKEILSSVEIGAGAYDLMDPIAIKVIERSRIRAYIVNGKDPLNIERALRGESVGTRIIHKGD